MKKKKKNLLGILSTSDKKQNKKKEKIYCQILLLQIIADIKVLLK